MKKKFAVVEVRGDDAEYAECVLIEAESALEAVCSYNGTYFDSTLYTIDLQALQVREFDADGTALDTGAKRGLSSEECILLYEYTRGVCV